MRASTQHLVFSTSPNVHASMSNAVRCLTSSKHSQDHICITILHMLFPAPSKTNHLTRKYIMSYTSQRRSSVQFTAEATMGVSIRIARRKSHAGRTIRPSSTSHWNNRNHTVYPHYNRIVVRESSSPAYASLHALCVARDATYARLSARLDRMRGYKAAVAFYVRERRGSAVLGQVLEFLGDDVGRLERIMEGMRRKIEEGGSGWDASGKAFSVGGRWAAFL
jgi:hypothetical protein